MIQHSLSGMFAVRQNSWKLILGRGSGGFTNPRHITPEPGEPVGQLYDLSTDPAEERNLYLDHPAVVDSLAALLERYQTAGRSRR